MHRGDRVHLGVVRVRPRRTTVGRAANGGQRAGRAVRHAAARRGLFTRRRWPRKASSEPAVPEGRVGRHSRDGVPFQTPSDEVEEHGVVAALQSRLEFARSGRSSRFASS